MSQHPLGLHPNETTPKATPEKAYGEIVGLLLSSGCLTDKQLKYAIRVRSKLQSNRTLLDTLEELKSVTHEQIQKTIRANCTAIRIGSLLVELGHISEADLETAIQTQSEEKPKRKLGEVLVSHHFIGERELAEVLSMQLDLPYIEPELSDIDPFLLSKAPYKMYKKNAFIPVQMVDRKIQVAFSDPLDSQSVEAAKRIFGPDLATCIASKRSIMEALEQMERDQKRPQIKGVDETSVVEIVETIIKEAIQENDVSDIHLEPLSDRLRVRFRRDGVLVHYKDFRKELIPALSSRIKIMCEADIAEKRRHQGGRLLFDHAKGQADIRVSFYVTIHGEKIALRLLNRQTELRGIDEIGMSSRMLERFLEDALDRQSGVVTVTGPTGSGKTSTVYSCVNYLDNPQTSIITAEEPVEYVIDGIAQCSINPKINLTFDETLRHIVRQDPDVVVIGEIRDTFSAEVAVQAALTGHQVLTTFHTEDSIGGLIRLLNMDIDAFLISSTVVCIVAQRLLRRVCSHCRVPYQITTQDLRLLGYTPKDVVGGDFIMGRGCPKCRHTGYKGRVAVFEILILNEAVRDGLLERKTSHQIRRISTETTGLVTLLEDGIVKAATGKTSIDDVLRILPRLQKPRPLAEVRRLSGD